MVKALLSVAKIFLTSVAISIIGRVLFLIVQSGAALKLTFGTLLQSFGYGLMLDISVAGYITALPLLMVIVGVWCGGSLSAKAWRRVLRLYLVIISLLLSIIIATDALMYGHWGYKIDATLLPYLTSPKDAAASATFVDVLIWCAAALTILFVAMKLYFRSVDGFEMRHMKRKQQLLWTPLLLLVAGVLFLGIRGGVSKAVANVSKVYFSTEQFANHAAVNPAFSLLSSIARVQDYDQMYPFYEEEELLRRFKEIQGNDSTKASQQILKHTRPNIALIICESYTKHIMDMDIDGRAVMPHLRQIATEGLNFENAYAAGARTDRGVATILSGFPTQPKLSIMKIPAKSRNLPSLAASLAREGYSSNFYYGGDLNFMDMASYLYSTGWNRLMWDRDIVSPNESPRNWGYSDGVTMSLFADEVISLDREGEPFIAALLTLSSHEPFDVPEDMGFEDRMLNSMAYSDAKLGAMIDRLKNSSAWEDLLVVIVADHTFAYPYDVSYNSPLRHHIPLILSGGALKESSVESSFVSQMDIAATLLSQMDISHADYPFSRDIFDKSANAAPKYGYYTFSDGFGVVSADGATIYDNNMQSAGLATPAADRVKMAISPSDLSATESEQLERGKTTLQMTHYLIEKL